MSPLEIDASRAIWFLTDIRSLKAEHLQVLSLGFADVGNSTYVSVSGSGELCTEHAVITLIEVKFKVQVRLTGPPTTAKLVGLAHSSVRLLEAIIMMLRRSSQISNRSQPTPLSHAGKALLTSPTLPTIRPPTANRLLAALPEAEYQRLAPHLQPFALPRGLVLYERGTQLSHVYFPTDGIVSLLVAMEDGSSGQVAVIGSEGVVGVSLFMGGRSSNSAVVHSCGHGYRLRAGYLMQEFDRGGFLMNVLLRFAQSLITQMAQTAVCNRLHTIDQQLCCWLLLSLDRLPDDQIKITQETIAHMLGVRRESVTAAAGQLHNAGLISYRRGLITVLDRPTLEQRVCECYAVVKRETDRLLTPRAAGDAGALAESRPVSGAATAIATAARHTA